MAASSSRPVSFYLFGFYRLFFLGDVVKEGMQAASEKLKHGAEIVGQKKGEMADKYDELISSLPEMASNMRDWTGKDFIIKLL
jgi:hypothetical protein